MQQRYAPGLFDRLMDELPRARDWSLEQLKDAVARDLEALFNSRAALADAVLEPYPEVRSSILNYGLIDFAGMCLTSDVDKQQICAAVRLAIDRHEPRLYAVSAALRASEALVNRVDIVISARLRADPAAELVRFDAVLKPSTQQYAIHRGGPSEGGAA
jgi:type VI secretion system protein ImpF